MFNNFLKNQNYAFLIAKVAIVFQSVVTLLVCTLLTLSLFGITYPYCMLQGLLIMDIIFVAAHVSYRVLYNGKKVILSNLEKRILLAHILTALTALTMTIILVKNTVLMKTMFTWITLMTWEVSFIFGILFFMKKYKKERIT